MNQTKETKTDNITLSINKKIVVTIIFSLILFIPAIFLEDLAIGYALSGLFITPMSCAYLISKYLFGGEKNP